MDIREVEKELKKGWKATSQLRGLLLPVKEDDNSNNNCGEKEFVDLDNQKLLTFKKNCCSTIIKSFDSCLSILNSKEASNNLQINRRNVINQAAPESQTSENFGQLIKPKHTRVKTIETPNLAPDGYLWRKYGRKPIQHAPHPREYYRCAYRHEQNCQATKHVQMISQNPTMYRINYYSDHICQIEFHNKNITQTQDKKDCSDKDCTNIISFESKTPTYIPKQNLKPFVPDSLPSFGEGGMSSMVSLTQESEGTSTSKKVESSLTVDVEILKERDVVFSPSKFMSPNYIMGSSLLNVEEDYSTFTASDDVQFNDIAVALQSQDIPLWEHGLFSC